MHQPYLVNIKDAAAILGLAGLGPARRWLRDKGIPMIDYGPGRGLGPRWPRDAILEAVQSALVYPASATPPKPRKIAPRPVLGRSRKELLDEFASHSEIQ